MHNASNALQFLKYFRGLMRQVPYHAKERLVVIGRQGEGNMIAC